MTRLRSHVVALVMMSSALTAIATTPETWVEPYNKDCASTPAKIRPQVFGDDGAAGSVDLDGDNNYEAIGTSEDSDTGDTVYLTISTAITNTSTGGIIHVPSGHYREALTITDSVTIRGPKDGSAILEGVGGANCATVLSRAIDITGTGKTVILENLTIQGCSVQGIRCDNSNLRLINCRVQFNAIGISPPNSTYRFELIDSAVISNTGDGLNGSDTGSWLVVGSSISNNGGDGIDLANGGTGSGIVQVINSRIVGNTGLGVKTSFSNNGVHVTVDGSVVSSNGGTGVSVIGKNTGSFRVTNSTLESNGGDGLYVENNAGTCVSVGTALLGGIVEDSRIFGNVSDGIELKETGSGCSVPNVTSKVKASIYLNSISMNGAYGLRSTGCTFDCGLGRNQLAYNVSGVETGGTFCTIASDSKNQ